jgi:hypothetical protein
VRILSDVPIFIGVIHMHGDYHKEERISSELAWLPPPPLNLLLPSRMFSSQLNLKLIVDYNKFSRENLQSKLSQLRIVLSIAHIVANIV